MNQQHIPCPACKTPIPFNVYQLLQGMQFVCPNCYAVIKLSAGSKPLVEDAMSKFEQLKEKQTISNK